jgi:hypothetical protein
VLPALKNLAKPLCLKLRIMRNSVTYHLSPITYHLSPITYHLSPITYQVAIVELRCARTLRNRSPKGAAVHIHSRAKVLIEFWDSYRGICSQQHLYLASGWPVADGQGSDFCYV